MSSFQLFFCTRAPHWAPSEWLRAQAQFWRCCTQCIILIKSIISQKNIFSFEMSKPKSEASPLHSSSPFSPAVCALLTICDSLKHEMSSPTTLWAANHERWAKSSWQRIQPDFQCCKKRLLFFDLSCYVYDGVVSWRCAVEIAYLNHWKDPLAVCQG